MQSFPALPRRFRNAVLALVALVGLYALAGFLLLPYVARSAIHSQIEKLGRHVAIGEFTFNPFTLEARIGAFRLTESDGSALIAFRQLRVNAAFAASLWQRGLVLQEFVLEAPEVSLIRAADGSINLTRLAPPAAEARPSDKPAAALPRIRIGTFTVEDGKVEVRDLSRPQPFATVIAPVRFTLKDFRTDAGHDNPYQFSARLESGEQIDWSGEFGLQPLGSRGHFELKDLHTQTLVAYLQDQLPVRLVSGTAELGGDYELRLDPALSLELKLPALSVRQLALAEPGAAKAEPPLTIENLGLHDLAFSLARREVSVGSVEIGGVHAALVREADGSLSLSRLVRTQAQPERPSAEAAPPKSAPWRIGIAQIKLEGSALAFEDRSVKPAAHFAIAPIAASVAGFTTDPDAKLGVHAELTLNRSGHLLADGTLQLQPLAAAAQIVLKDFELPAVQPYLAATTAMNLASGRLGAKGELRYAAKADAAPQLAFSGELNVAGFDARDQAKQDFLKWRALDIGGIDFGLAPDHLNIASVALHEPYARVVIDPDRTVNVAKIMIPQPAPAPPKPDRESRAKASGKTAPVKPMPIRVQSIRIDKGSANFADLSIKPTFAAAIVALHGSVTGLSSDPAARAKIHLEGQVDKYSPVVISGETSPFAPMRYTDVALSFRNMDLSIFNPYSGRFAGYNIAKGKLSTELKYEIRDRQLKAEHHVIVDQLEFGDATGSKEAVPLPIRLAAALLKDRHGVIDLELPVGGSLDDPAFRIGPVIWKVFVNLLTKIVASPFAALGSLFGGGEELSYVDFKAGSAQLAEDQAAKLGKLAAALVERPQLRLDVPLTRDDARDGPALAAAALAHLMPAPAADADPESVAKSRLRALERIYRDQFRASPEYPAATAADKNAERSARIDFLKQRLTERLAPDATMLDQLAKDRAQAVEAALLVNPSIAPERIFITADSVAPTTDSGAVRMTLKLQ